MDVWNPRAALQLCLQFDKPQWRPGLRGLRSLQPPSYRGTRHSRAPRLRPSYSPPVLRAAAVAVHHGKLASKLNHAGSASRPLAPTATGRPPGRANARIRTVVAAARTDGAARARYEPAIQSGARCRPSRVGAVRFAGDRDVPGSYCTDMGHGCVSVPRRLEPPVSSTLSTADRLHEIRSRPGAYCFKKL